MNQDIREAKRIFPESRLTDTQIRILRKSWKLTEAEIVANWEVYPCQMNWALRRGGCGCTAIQPIGTQLCGQNPTRQEVLAKLNECL